MLASQLVHSRIHSTVRTWCHSYTYPPGVVIVGEIDGLRIISASVSDFVQKVPASTLAVFQPGSTSPAAILFDAKEQFDRKSARADEAIRSVKSELPGAVDTCVEAAGLERDPKWQKKLLNVSSLICYYASSQVFDFWVYRLLHLGELFLICTTLLTS